ncbi:hypothetical protein FSP39_002912 [Pinctada imbricata]|uniref:Mitochondrial ribosomal protein S11 n=1 Tax=Pinctada imbricata TaxID=66713 RepID=A0AA89BYJ4_PINIB|nr:hypothetical protein FSP39_002912 [Pinctada imbricata]
MNAVLNCLGRCQRTLLSQNLRRFVACNFGSVNARESETTGAGEAEGDSDQNIDVKRSQNYVAQYYRRIFATPDIHDTIVDGMKFGEVPVIRINNAKNNTFLCLTKGSGGHTSIIAQVSCASLGFTGKKKKTQYAAQALSLRIAELAKENNVNTVRVVIKGFGTGRQPSLEGLKIGGLRIISITDNTQLKNGRPGARRRV